MSDLKSKTPRLNRGVVFYEGKCTTTLNYVKRNLHV